MLTEEQIKEISKRHQNIAVSDLWLIPIIREALALNDKKEYKVIVQITQSDMRVMSNCCHPIPDGIYRLDIPQDQIKAVNK